MFNSTKIKEISEVSHRYCGAGVDPKHYISLEREGGYIVLNRGEELQDKTEFLGCIEMALSVDEVTAYIIWLQTGADPIEGIPACHPANYMPGALEKLQSSIY